MIRLLIVDDHDLVRIGLKQVFQGRVDMEIAGEARTGEEAIAKIRAQPFDVALVDLSLSDMSGVDVLTRAKAIRPEMAVLIVSGYPEDQYAINLLKAGAAGFVAKDAPPDHLVSAVVAASQGRRYVSPTTADKLAQGLSAGGNADGRAVAHASFRARVPDLLQARGRPERLEHRQGALHQREDREHLSLAHPGEDEFQDERGHHVLRRQESTHRVIMPLDLRIHAEPFAVGERRRSSRPASPHGRSASTPISGLSPTCS